MKDGVSLQAGEVIDASFMDVSELKAFLQVRIYRYYM
jgi:monomeric isocitrate dehydrogenase